jgi:hypothetical protein
MKLLRIYGKQRCYALNWQWEPRDLWVGAFWRVSETGMFHLYICLLPLIPFHLTIMWNHETRTR